ncbi:mitochondrial import inner membrane translocase subunit Tim54 [Umbelopsis sp. AD052]|nr:mitochondrial import inner membrane translocase subunit Tim54 [Umbelopsis sp. AD052]
MTTRKLPFGLKAPSRGTVIFGSIVFGISGIVYGSNYYSKQSHQRLYDRVTWLADRPLGVREMPRKVTIYIAPPPGDGMDKSRVWFREYVKPVLYKAAVDYEVREGRNNGDIEAMICEEIRQKRKAAKEGTAPPMVAAAKPGSPFSPVPVQQNEIDGIIAIGRVAWREVLNGLAKGCEAPLKDEKIEEVKPEAAAIADEKSATPEETSNNNQPEQLSFQEEPNNREDDAPLAGEPAVVVTTSGDNSQDYTLVDGNMVSEEEPAFSLPPSFPPVMYIPHNNVIGWLNIPYRLFLWAADYKRVDWIGEYSVAVALNERKPLEKNEIDVGQAEKKYWLGDEAKEMLTNDTPIKLDDRVREHLTTFVRS